MKLIPTKRTFLSATLSRAMLAAGLALALFAAPAQAVDRLVPAAFATIRAAVAAAVSGDRILVGPGIYQENVTSNIPNLQFIGKSTVWDGTLTNGTAAACLTSTGDVVSVQGFIFRAGPAGAPLVDLTGNGCKVSKCSAQSRVRGRFLKMTGNSNRVESCSMFALGGPGIEIVGDRAVVKKVLANQCDGDVIRVTGHFAAVSGCTMSLCEDSASIRINGSNAVVSDSVFLYGGGTDITVTGGGSTIRKNKSVRNGGGFLTAGDNTLGHLVTQNSATRLRSSFLSITGSNSVVTLNKATDCVGNFLSSSSSGAGAIVEQNTVTHCGGTFLSVVGSNSVIRKNVGMDLNSTFLSASSTGTGPLVEQNTVTLCRGTFLNISGSNSVVRQNKATDLSGTFLSSSAAGQRATVEQNTVTRCYGSFISVSSSNSVIRKNVGTDVTGSFITANTSTAGPGPIVEQNTGTRFGGNFIDISGSNSVVSKNVATDCGSTFLSSGSDSAGAVIEGNTVTRCGSTFISVTGSNVVVRKNAATDCWGAFISQFGAGAGNGATVEMNTAMRCTSTFISVNGLSPVVRLNKAALSFGNLSATGDNAVVEQNQMVDFGSIYVEGDNFTIRKNTVMGAPNDRNGIYAEQATSAGGGLIEDNKVADAAGYGMYVDCNNAVIRGNSFTRTGSEGEGGCYIRGSFNKFTNNLVMTCNGPAFNVQGANNILVNCTANGASTDGFHINNDGCTLLKCVAMLCGGEGLDNRGLGTIVTGSVFKQNRIDVANDGSFLPDNATFILNNMFTTGGPTTPPQVD